jgi:hypothetical protein
MAKRFRKVCPSCQQLFLGRRDARTCGERCRKRLQRARMSDGLGADMSDKSQSRVFGANFAPTKVAAARRQEGGRL